MDSLSNKLEKVKDEQAAEDFERLKTFHSEADKADAFFLLGRIKQNDHIAQAIASNLAAQSIRALENFQQEKRYLPLGFATMNDFLDKSEHSPMTKRQYYDRLSLVRGNGDEVYDLLTSCGISVRAQKMLGNGELAIRGDALFIGDREVSLADAGVVKDVLNELFDDIRTREQRETKHAKQIKDQAERITQGEAEVEELRRSIDAMNEGTYYDRAFAHAVNSLLLLQEAIGSMPDTEREQKSQNGIDQLWTQIVKVRTSYGVNFAFAETNGGLASIVKDSNMVEDILRAVAEDDDFGDEEEA